MEIKLDLYVIMGIRGSEQPLLHVTTVPGPIALPSVKVMTFFHLLCTVIPLPLNVSKPKIYPFLDRQAYAVDQEFYQEEL